MIFGADKISDQTGPGPKILKISDRNRTKKLYDNFAPDQGQTFLKIPEQDKKFKIFDRSGTKNGKF